MVRLKGGNPHSSKEGGDESPLSLLRSLRELLFDKEELAINVQEPTKESQVVNRLIRTADWVRVRGQIRPISAVPAPEEQIGILINILRRSQDCSVEQLAVRCGYEVEELIAFEAGLLPRRRVLEMLPNLARNVGFADKDLLQILHTKNSKTPNQ